MRGGADEVALGLKEELQVRLAKAGKTPRADFALENQPANYRCAQNSQPAPEGVLGPKWEDSNAVIVQDAGSWAFETGDCAEILINCSYIVFLQILVDRPWHNLE